MNRRIRLLALDIDGTLVNSRDELTPATIAALRRAVDAGLHIVLATGRRYSRTLPLVEPLGIEAPLVTSSGALVKRALDHVTLYRASFDRDLLCSTLSIVEQAGYDAIMYGDTYAEGFDYYCRTTDVKGPELAEYLALNPQCERVCPDLMHDPPDGIFAGFAIGSRDDMLRLHEQFCERLPGQLYTHVLRSPRYRGYMCEIAPAGATKWAGIERVARQWNIADDEICAVGDAINDLPMIEGAGLGIAMGNAIDELKAVADRIAPGHDSDGLVQVVEWILA